MPENTRALQSAPVPALAQGWYVGLMSGTSLDGVDAVLARFSPREGAVMGGRLEQIEVAGHAHVPFEGPLVAWLKQLNAPGADELHRAALAENALAQRYAQAVQALCAQTGVAAADVVAIGAHGQTVRHQPSVRGEAGAIAALSSLCPHAHLAEQAQAVGRYTIQLNNPAWLAEQTGIAVVADFRRRDMAAGGQGAPLVPAFHRALFGQSGLGVAVLNLGGIANWSLIDSQGQTMGFDSGPANTLLDAWCQVHTGQPFDRHGQWAASGSVQQALLAQCMQEPYFHAPAPKSTGLDLFNMSWLQAHLELQVPAQAFSPEDVQATLVELTAVTVAQTFVRYQQGQRSVGVCGGGAFNTYLMERIAQHLQLLLGEPVAVHSTLEWGLGPEQVEAAAFAWLARQCMLGLPGNVPAATHARGERVLGAIYPA
ncbi:anhydro-N-acetylmuramic acid kinase [Lampropedia puyangensis]|uniref:Anhydro-N-acetylmuramic acid kinase n=1 Tax=Lampropedia puyangensis TaxID=1330072 RepID=A0A4S8F518_9BURK|nr:anhydro-N-acetylmuramic acid kinase [Lampropedia puyangensis]THU02533.1 anhydro-N-acetylmuramic acid kinase [Lampropedia puyangensis]